MGQCCLDKCLTHEGERSSIDLDIVDFGSESNQLAGTRQAGQNQTPPRSCGQTGTRRDRGGKMEFVARACMPELLSAATSFRRLKCVLLGYVSSARDRSSVENVHVPTLADCGLEFPRAVEPYIFVGTRQILTRDAKHISTGTEVALRFLSGCTPATLTTVSPQSSATAHDNSLNVVMPLEFHPNRGK